MRGQRAHDSRTKSGSYVGGVVPHDTIQQDTHTCAGAPNKDRHPDDPDPSRRRQTHRTTQTRTVV